MAEVKKYTKAEVAKRNGKDGGPVWMTFRNGVYDVTSYVSQHPGGEVMLEAAGKDATKALVDNHSADAIAIMEKHKIGEVVQGPEVKKYTIAEVAKRNGKDGGPVWMTYKNGVYDVTSFVPEHPGGEVMLEAAGKDATSILVDNHSAEAIAIMEKHKIGEIVDEEQKYDANGKKKKKVVAAKDGDAPKRSCVNIVTCGLLG